jgi:hypothetical protein
VTAPWPEREGLSLSLSDAAVLLTEPESLRELAYFAHGCRATDELAAVLDREATRCVRASDGFAALFRYDLAAEQRERARKLRLLSAALRVVRDMRDEQ